MKWLEELPEQWKHASLRYACGRITDGSHFSPKSIEEGKSYVTVRNIESGKVNVEGAAKISQEDFEQLEKAGCRPSLNDVLFSKDGTVGKVAIVENNDFVVLSSLAIISPHPEKLDSKFLFYFLQSVNGEKQIESLYAGAALRRITLDAIVGIWLPLPGLYEQQTIITFLDYEITKIDELVAAQQRLIDLLKEKRQAAISHAVTKGLNPNVLMKDSGIEWLGEVPQHWDVTSLKRECSLLKDGTHLPPPRVAKGIPLLSVRNIQCGKFDFREDDTLISEESYHTLCKSFIPKPNDVLLAIVGATLGKVALVPDGLDKFHIQRSLAIFRPVTRMNPKWLNFVFQAQKFQQLLWAHVSYSAQPGIYLGTLAQFRIPLPSLTEQNLITSFLDSETSKLDTLITEAKCAIELFNERRAALISAVVTGKINISKLV
ncbi:restriction endonuclease subunit S [Nitrosomonas communis]|uniref:restriction endonuclease subunit S n=1 Tax=Nitrosomonas communis TaxID=44574 RepID=UPI000944A0CD|nr:restriction endonuclease subunit S [Nitrosomonas communis]